MKIVSDLLVSVIEDHAEIRHDYSGRCMFGEKCFGFVAENPEAVIAEIQTDINGIYRPEEFQQEFSELLQHSRRDSMGFDRILYFPGYQTTETDKEAEEND